MDEETSGMPDTVKVSVDDAERVEIEFGYDNASVVIVRLDQSRLQVLLSELHGKIEHGNVVPLSPAGLSRTQMIQVHGTRFRVGSNGDFELTLFAEADGRGVTVPFSIDREEAAHWVRTIQTMG